MLDMNFGIVGQVFFELSHLSMLAQLCWKWQCSATVW